MIDFSKHLFTGYPQVIHNSNNFRVKAKFKLFFTTPANKLHKFQQFQRLQPF